MQKTQAEKGKEVESYKKARKEAELALQETLRR